MKIDRLIGILSILLQHEKVTAPYLADKFEVSKRTIHRDVENLCKAGLPIITEQGVHGGISIMEGYRVDKTLLTSKEMQAICSGLKSLDSITGSNKYQLLMDKLSLKNSNLLTANQHIMIDLSSWNTQTIAPKIELIQNAIEEHRLISFQYCAPSGDTKRTIEPYLLIFQWQAWYVWGYCTYRQEFRLFKLGRLDELMITSDTFQPRQIPNPEEVINQMGSSENLNVTALFDACIKWRVIEELGGCQMQETKEGKYYVQFQWSDEQSLFRYLLTYMDYVELIEPKELRIKFKSMMNHMIDRYKE